jgi:hypothetical protein
MIDDGTGACSFQLARQRFVTPAKAVLDSQSSLVDAVQMGCAPGNRTGVWIARLHLSCGSLELPRNSCNLAANVTYGGPVGHVFPRRRQHLLTAAER